MGPVGTKLHPRNMALKRTLGPNSGVTRRLFLPMMPKPAKTAASLRNTPPLFNMVGQGVGRLSQFFLEPLFKVLGH